MCKRLLNRFKQSTSAGNVTAFADMKIKIGPKTSPEAVYELIKRYLENGREKQSAELLLFGNVARFKEVVSWNFTEKSLITLWRSVNDSRAFTLGECYQYDARLRFVQAAFRDLSSVRNPAAMRVFGEIRAICGFDERLLLWFSKTVHTRVDGSAIIMLHVSNPEAFRVLRNQHTSFWNHATYDNLKEGYSVTR
jgi:hypothetical protein